MAAEISYWSENANQVQVAAGLISSETVATASATQSGATPATAKVVSVVASTAALRFQYGVNPAAAATGASSYLALNERIWIRAIPGYLFSCINA